MKANPKLLCAMALAAGLLGARANACRDGGTWDPWNIPTMSPPFADLRVITGGAESVRRGADPLFENPEDPWKRRMNYPRVWQGLAALGVGARHTNLLAAILIGALVAGVYLLLRPERDARILVAAFAALLSPAVLLGIERGNTDLLMFFLLALAAALAGSRPAGAAAAVLAGFILKLFPLFGFALFLRRNRKAFAVLAGLFAAAVAAYAALTFSDIVEISRATPRRSMLSYGTDVIGIRIGEIAGAGAGRLAIVASRLVAMGLVAWAFFRALRPDAFVPDPEGPRTDAFRIGAGVYAGTFLIGANFDYRLMFLVFTIPQLVEWSSHPARRIFWTAILTLAGVFLSLWHLVIARFLHFAPKAFHAAFFADEIANWTVFAGILLLLGISLPSATKERLRRLLRRPDPA